MRGRKRSTPIRLDTEQFERLRKLALSRTAAHAIVTRAKAILLLHEHPDWSDEQIGRQVGYCSRTVRRWRHVWVNEQRLLDRPRSGRPRAFSP